MSAHGFLSRREIINNRKITTNTAKITSNWTINSNNIYYGTGNVGIGTTTPTYPLEIHGFTGRSGMNPDGAGTPRWVSLNDPYDVSGTGYHGFLSGLLSNTTGTIKSKMSVWAEYGYVTKSGYFQASDGRIKSFEKPIPVGLKEILQLEPKKYLKHPTIFVDADDETGKTLPIDEEGKLFQMSKDGKKEPLECELELGLISQAIEKIEGLEILVTDEINGIKNVNYIGLIPVLIKALQEQQIIIDTEKAKTATLETKTATLETTVADLVARITALENA